MDDSKQRRIEGIYRQINEISAYYHEAIGHTGVSDNEFWVWYSLVAIGGEQSQQDICAAWSLSKQTVNTIVRRMVDRGHAELVPAPGARNRKVIVLTERGREHGEGIVRPVREAEWRMFDRLDDALLNECSSIFSAFLGILREARNEEQTAREAAGLGGDAVPAAEGAKGGEA